MAKNSKPEQRKSSADGVRASGGSGTNEDEDQLLEDDEAADKPYDGQGIQAAGAQQDDDDDAVTESPDAQRASVEGELGQGRQAGSERGGRGGKNARGR